GCPRVTHPSAARSTAARPEGRSTASRARLACIRHAASVRPEPRSNSPIKFEIRLTPINLFHGLLSIGYRVFGFPSKTDSDIQPLTSDIFVLLFVLFSFQGASWPWGDSNHHPPPYKRW